jgi:hypothetical protein
MTNPAHATTTTAPFELLPRVYVLDEQTLIVHAGLTEQQYRHLQKLSGEPPTDRYKSHARSYVIALDPSVPLAPILDYLRTLALEHSIERTAQWSPARPDETRVLAGPGCTGAPRQRLSALLRADTLELQPGWEFDPQARLEAQIARALELDIQPLDGAVSPTAGGVIA